MCTLSRLLSSEWRHPETPALSQWCPLPTTVPLFSIIIILSPGRFFRNMFLSFFLHFVFFSSLSFLAVLSIFVAPVRYKWWPSGDLPYTHFVFFWQTILKYTFPTAVRGGDMWDSNFELWTPHLIYRQRTSISFSFIFLSPFVFSITLSPRR